MKETISKGKGQLSEQKIIANETTDKESLSVFINSLTKN